MTSVCINDEIMNFKDTVTILIIPEVLISVGSSAIHLAGAFSQSSLGDVAFVAEWLWLIERKNSHCYPSLRLSHQYRAND